MKEYRVNMYHIVIYVFKENELQELNDIINKQQCCVSRNMQVTHISINNLDLQPFVTIFVTDLKSNRTTMNLKLIFMNIL
jgi:hypothetical protein